MGPAGLKIVTRISPPQFTASYGGEEYDSLRDSQGDANH
jgi:hypothetical protein